MANIVLAYSEIKFLMASMLPFLFTFQNREIILLDPVDCQERLSSIAFDNFVSNFGPVKLMVVNMNHHETKLNYISYQVYSN
jgi:hypothetical protein